MPSMHLGFGTTLALTVVALVAGGIDAIAGGGGLLTVPALLHAGLNPLHALGTNKGQSVFGSGAATLRFARAGRLNVRRSLATFALGFSGAMAGAVVVSHVNAATLKPLVIVLLVAAAVLVMLPRPSATRAPRRPLLVAMAIALAVGFYDGFFGPGTGTLLIVAFIWLLAENAGDASAHAKVVNFASNLAAVAWFGSHGLIFWSVSLPMAAGQFVGGLIGAHVVITRGGGVVRVAAVTTALAMVAKLAWDILAAR